jgi:hypothetical protein
MLQDNEWGLGDSQATVKVYIANQPNFTQYANSQSLQPLATGEIRAIGTACGNGWRKVFNVYAKLLFALNTPQWANLGEASNWQSYRDRYLLQAGSGTALLFSAPQLPSLRKTNPALKIVMGKRYANSLLLPGSLLWLDGEFAIDPQSNLLVCPYFDYRQLSNIKILHLVELIKSLAKSPVIDNNCPLFFC